MMRNLILASLAGIVWAVGVSIPANADLDAGSDQLFRQGAGGVSGETEAGDQFGLALAVGDFDGDGYEDLAIGVRGEDSGAGAVNVLYGDSVGLSAAGNQFWSQDSTGVFGDPEKWDYFGSALAAGDFDGDGYDDLAIGVPFEDHVTADEDGGVHVLYGGAGGLTATGSQFWSQDSAGVAGEAEENDLFGWTLTAGDFDGDGYEDLAIGVLGEDTGAGAVNVLYGGAAGLTATGNQFWNQASAGVFGDPEANDLFGSALTAGDFDGDGYDDLAVGVPNEAYLTAVDDGGVHVLYGGAGGLTATGSQFWSQGSPGITCCAPEVNDWFGSALTAGDFDGDGYEDLAIGVRGEDNLAGAVNVLYGDSVGLSATGNQFWNQASAGVFGGPEAYDDFGQAVVAGDFDGDGYDDLAIGVPLEDYLTAFDDGGVHVLYGGAGGLTATGSQFWSQDSPGMDLDTAEEDDYFGRPLVAGDFNGNGARDLAVGVFGEDWDLLLDSGIVQVLYDSSLIFANGFEPDDTSVWSATVP